MKIKHILFISIISLLMLSTACAINDINDTSVETTKEKISNTESNIENKNYNNKIEKRKEMTEDILSEETEYDISKDLNERVDVPISVPESNYDNQTTRAIKDIYVNVASTSPTETGSIQYPYKTLQSAVSATQSGYENILHISPGTYKLSSTLTLNKNIKFKGTNKDNTLINCNQIRGFKINSGIITFQDVTIYNARNTQGGAILIETNSKLTINNCIMRNNVATNNGGVLFSSGSNNEVQITNTKFNSNTASKLGGAIQTGGDGSKFIIRNSYFTNNIVTHNIYTDNYGFGGAIYSGAHSIVVIDKCNFSSNKALYGNAIANANEAKLNVTNTNITNNIADSNINLTQKTKGGAISVGSGIVYINNVYFSNNKADIAGAITINSGQKIDIYNCIFNQNRGYTQAGAIYNFGTLTIKNTKFIKNDGGRRGGAILDGGNKEIFIENSNFVGNFVSTNLINNTSKTPQGGAISITGRAIRYTIVNSLFDHNSAYYGGAIFSDYEVKKLTLNKNTFKNNTAKMGAGLLISGDTQSDICNCTFNYNRALLNGAGIYFDGSNSIINKTNFYDNVVSTTGKGDGGAIHIQKHTILTIYNSNFNNNYANLKGGVICALNTSTIFISASNMTNNHASTGSVIYSTYTTQTRANKIQVITSLINGNTGNYAFFSYKVYNPTSNIIEINYSYWGSNTNPSNQVKNFLINKYFLLTITIGNSINTNINWNSNTVTINIARTHFNNNNVYLNIKYVKSGNNYYPMTGDFLPTLKYSKKENNNPFTYHNLYCSSLLKPSSTSITQITIKFYGQTIICNII